MNKLLRVLFLSFSVFGFSFSSANADYSRDDLKDLIEKADEFRASTSLEELLPERQSNNKYGQEARSIWEEAVNSSPNDQYQNIIDRCSTPKTYIFVSYSMEEDELNEVLRSVSGKPDVALIFRGIPKNEKSLTKGMLKIQLMAREFNPMPSIEINPTLFKENKVEFVPTIVKLDAGVMSGTGCKQAQIARLEGINNVDHFEYQLAQGERGDLGVKGPTLPIAEPDLIEEMKRRVAKIDWETKKKNAKARFLTNYTFYELKPATKTQTRFVQASVMLSSDLKDNEGNVLVKKGTVVNPLKIRQWTQTVIVFDATDKKQVQFLLEEVESRKELGEKLVLIASKIDTDNGWNDYNELVGSLDLPVTFLTPDVISRFHLDVTPSIITANDDSFVINEIKVDPNVTTEGSTS